MPLLGAGDRLLLSADVGTKDVLLMEGSYV